MKIVPERMLAFNYNKIYNDGRKAEFIKNLIEDMKRAGCKDFSNGGGVVNVLEKTGQEYGGEIYSVAEFFKI